MYQVRREDLALGIYVPELNTSVGGGSEWMDELMQYREGVDPDLPPEYQPVVFNADNVPVGIIAGRIDANGNVKVEIFEAKGTFLLFRADTLFVRN